jgi:hypothetical protein
MNAYTFACFIYLVRLPFRGKGEHRLVVLLINVNLDNL